MRRRGRPPYPDILTPREWEVLALLRQGLSNEQIAERLNVTIHASRYHVSEILSKLGVSSRQEAAAWEPEKAKPFWTSALAFVLWPWKHIPFAVAAKASAAAVVVGATVGMGFLAWGLIVTSGQDNENGERFATASTATPTVAAAVAVGSPAGTPYSYPSSFTGTPTLTVTPSPPTPTIVPPTPFLTPTATPAPTPTLPPGVCPEPYRQTPEDFTEPPPLRPASEIPGQRVQGGVPYNEAYVTLYPPAGREFIILSGWSQDNSSVVLSIYDAQTGSSLILRADGCEIGRFVRDPAADAAFDEMMKTLDVGSAYVCPVPTREVVSPPTTEARGSIVEGGESVRLGPMTLHLPAGCEFTLASVPVDPGGTVYGVYDVQSRSSMSLRGDGCEIRRWVSDPAADSVFDEILAGLEAPSR